MLKLVFAEAGTGPTLEAGPYDEIVMDGEAMCEGGAGRVIARHRDHHWFVGPRKFFRVDCNRAVRVHFEDAAGASEPIGPFVHFSSADGIAYGDGTQIAHVEPGTGLWFSHLHRRSWQRMVVRQV